MINKFFLGLSGILIMGSCSTKNEKVQADQKPNIILIMADDVAPEHFSCLGGVIPTPNIDKLAAEGMIFNRAYAPSAACTPSRYSIITGQYAGRCNADSFTSSISPGEPYKIAWNTPITEKNLTLHEVLAEAGYFTGYVGKFHIGSLEFDRPEHNTDIPEINPDADPNDPKTDSLLRIYQSVIEKRVQQLTGCSYTASIQWENPEQMPVKAIRHHNLEWLTRGAAEFLTNRDEAKPFFLHFNTTALHGPNHFYDLHEPARYTPEGILENPFEHHPPRNTIFERVVELGRDTGANVPDHIKHYDAGIIYLDDQVGAIMKMIEKQGVKENTLVILTADHAIEPGKSTCYERGLRVPFIVSWPAKIKPGSQTNELVQFTDFLPTFASIGGINLPDEVKIDGENFASLLLGDKLLERQYIFSEEGYTRSVTGKKYKYIAMRFPDDVIENIENGTAGIITHFGDQFQAHGLIASKYHKGYFDADQLYDLENDPWEQNNLVYDPDYSDILDKMKEKMKKFTSTFDFPFPLENDHFMISTAYEQVVSSTKNTGTSQIYWWKRELEYPPEIKIQGYQ
jgi:arylsulfatase A-like enzyme